jgi:hypothetical protein
MVFGHKAHKRNIVAGNPNPITEIFITAIEDGFVFYAVLRDVGNRYYNLFGRVPEFGKFFF